MINRSIRGLARLGMARHGRAWHGRARQGKAWRGNRGEAPDLAPPRPQESDGMIND